MEIIRLKNMVFHGYHGVMEHEKAWGARFEADLELQCDLSKAMDSDSLSDTVDYEKIYHCVENIMSSRKFFLIEALAAQICRSIKNEFPAVSIVRCTLRKPHAPIRGVLDTIEVVVSL